MHNIWCRTCLIQDGLAPPQGVTWARLGSRACNPRPPDHLQGELESAASRRGASRLFLSDYTKKNVNIFFTRQCIYECSHGRYVFFFFGGEIVFRIKKYSNLIYLQTIWKRWKVKWLEILHSTKIKCFQNKRRRCGSFANVSSKYLTLFSKNKYLEELKKYIYKKNL